MLRLSWLFSAASVPVFILAGCVRLEQACIAMPAAMPVSPPSKSGFSISGDSELSHEDILSSAMPSYIPIVMQVTENELTTTLDFTVDRQGNVLLGIRVNKSSGYKEWDENVISTLSRWRFKPSQDVTARKATITFRMIRP